MGGSSSRPAPAPVVNLPSPPPPPPPPPPPSPAQLCAIRKVEKGQIERDLQQKQQQVDSCDPQAALARRIEEETEKARQFAKEKRDAANTHVADFKKQADVLDKIYDTSSALSAYVSEVQKDADELEARQKKLKDVERMHRRRFMDSDPQDGVSGFLGIRTTDDKILFAFWICYGVALISILLFVFRTFGANMDAKTKKTISAVTLIGGYLIAYTFIINYA